MKHLFFILLLIPVLVFVRDLKACTAFCLKNADGIFLAKNLDWEIESGYLFLNERGTDKFILNTEIFNRNEFCWKSKYRNITFNQFGKEFPFGGMNEQGLVIEELNMAPVTLIRDSTKQIINEFQLVQYVLDNCKSVDETIEQLRKFQCEPLFQTLHYIITDRLGNVIVVEFNGSDFIIYFPGKTGFPVLSNNNYNESLKYLTKFQGFGGDLPIINRPGSNERFVSVASLLASYNNQPPVTYSFQILDTVKQEDTKWSLVYDIKNLRVNFVFHTCKTIKVFDFRNLIEFKSVAGLGGSLSDCNFLNSDGLNKVTSKENTLLIQNVFSFYAQLDKSEVNYNLLYQMAGLGNQNLEQSMPGELVNELDSYINELPDASPLFYPDKLFDNIIDWENYQIVALGEATHGTKEFFELKHRIFRYLVENFGFKALAYEYSFRKSLIINDFVQNGIGNIDTLLSGEYWIQNNDEFKTLIRWMRNYNQYKNPEEKIYFIGIDNQIEAIELIECMNYLEENYPMLYTGNEKLFSEINQLIKIPYRDITNQDYKDRKELFQKLKFQAEIFLSTAQFQTDNVSAKIALQLIQSIINSHEFLHQLSANNDNLRDLQLAQNVLTIKNWFRENSKIVVWAHNAHIANNPDYYDSGKPAMGKYLKDKLDNEYLAIASSFSIGKFKAVMLDSLGNDTKPLNCEILETPPFGSTNFILHKAKYKNFVLNINELNSESTLYKYLNIKRPLIGVGDLYLGSPEKHFSDDRIINLITSYNLLFYFAFTHPVTIIQNGEK